MTIESAIGLGAVVAMIVGLIKLPGGIPDGYAGIVAVAGNVAIYAVLVIGGFFSWDLVRVDGIAGVFAQVIEIVGPFILSIGGSFGAHKLARSMTTNS
jgi:hypothetical protein